MDPHERFVASLMGSAWSPWDCAKRRAVALKEYREAEKRLMEAVPGDEEEELAIALSIVRSRCGA